METTPRADKAMKNMLHLDGDEVEGGYMVVQVGVSADDLILEDDSGVEAARWSRSKREWTWTVRRRGEEGAPVGPVPDREAVRLRPEP